MKVILDEKTYDNIWNKVYTKFKFKPSTDINVTPFEFDIDYRSYKLNDIWTEEQEKIVNDIFKEISNDDIYALDWHHDCFEFNPKEEITLDYKYHDADRDVEVYFPRYYPNGNYYFFISKDFSYGLLGHPWRKEIYVFGNELINKFENKMKQLDLSKNNISSDNLILNSLNDIFKELEKQYKIEWINNNKDSFFLYFSNNNNNKKYRIYADEDYISIDKEKKFFMFRYWEQITHSHCEDFEDSTFLEIYKVIIFYITKYKNIIEYWKDVFKNLISILHDKADK